MDIHIIKKLVRDRKLIPFIGAGFSKPLNLPNWGELMRNLAEDLEWDPDVFIQSGSGDFLQLAEYYSIKKSIGELRHSISKRFIVSEDNITQSLCHEYLVKMDPKTIYTTNYDEGIETAFKVFGNKQKKYKVIRNINDFKETTSEDNTFIYKFHGDLVNDESLVLTESSYFERLAFEHPLDIRLRSDILNNTLLFLGYSLRDINMRFIFYKLAKIQKEIKAHTTYTSAIMVTSGITDIQKTILESWGIEVEELDPIDKTKSLAEFLKKITE